MSAAVFSCMSAVSASGLHPIIRSLFVFLQLLFSRYPRSLHPLRIGRRSILVNSRAHANPAKGRSRPGSRRPSKLHPRLPSKLDVWKQSTSPAWVAHAPSSYALAPVDEIDRVGGPCRLQFPDDSPSSPRVRQPVEILVADLPAEAKISAGGLSRSQSHQLSRVNPLARASGWRSRTLRASGG